MLLIALVLTTGCKPVSNFYGDFRVRDLEGTWVDEANTATTISRRGEVLSIVDQDDGEAYTVNSYGGDGPYYRWAYTVPSTGYVVEIKVSAVDGDTATTSWSNDHGATGRGWMERQP